MLICGKDEFSILFFFQNEAKPPHERGSVRNKPSQRGELKFGDSKMREVGRQLNV
jgi:hypothetical protein